MPRLHRLPRRRSDPAELAAILHRLEGLRVGVGPAGWLPSDPAAQPGRFVQPEQFAKREQFAEPAHVLEVGQVGRGRPPDKARAAPRPPRAPTRSRLPAAVRDTVFDPGRRGVAVLAALALIGALAGAWYFIAARPATAPAASRAASAAQTQPLAATSRAPASPGGTANGAGLPGSGWPGTASASSATSGAQIVVDVVGKVAAPGVVELPAGARIRDAIAAAGGALPGTDLTALDLASRLSDGQEIFVGIPPPTGSAAQAAGGVVGGDAAGAGTARSSDGGSSTSGVVDINAATAADLETLPGVGPVLAQHIIDWRAQHGRFTAVTQLEQVPGIGPSKYAALAGRVRA